MSNADSSDDSCGTVDQSVAAETRLQLTLLPFLENNAVRHVVLVDCCVSAADASFRRISPTHSTRSTYTHPFLFHCNDSACHRSWCLLF